MLVFIPALKKYQVKREIPVPPWFGVICQFRGFWFLWGYSPGLVWFWPQMFRMSSFLLVIYIQCFCLLVSSIERDIPPPPLLPSIWDMLGGRDGAGRQGWNFSFCKILYKNAPLLPCLWISVLSFVGVCRVPGSPRNERNETKKMTCVCATSK